MVGVAVKVIFVPAQIVVLGVLIETFGVLDGLTVIVIALLIILFAVTQPALLVNTQVMISLFAKVLLLYVEEFVPTVDPFFFQVYVGVVPPLFPTAVKLTVVPLQIVVALALIPMVGVTEGLTVTTMLLLILGSMAHI